MYKEGGEGLGRISSYVESNIGQSVPTGTESRGDQGPQSPLHSILKRVMRVSVLDCLDVFDLFEPDLVHHSVSHCDNHICAQISLVSS